jgi:hypothetical protein
LKRCVGISGLFVSDFYRSDYDKAQPPRIRSILTSHPRAVWCIRAWALYDKWGEHEHERYGTSIRTPATGPPTAAMKCGSWSAMGKVSSRSRSCPAPDDHYSRSNSSEQSTKMRIGKTSSRRRRVRSGTDGRRRREGAEEGAGQGQATARQGQREGGWARTKVRAWVRDCSYSEGALPVFLCFFSFSKRRGRGVVCGDVCGDGPGTVARGWRGC